MGRSTVLHTLNPAADFPRAAFGFYAGALTRVPCHGGRGEAGEAGTPREVSERAAERGANVGGRGKKQKMKTRERRKRERKRKKPIEREKNTKRERE